MAFLIYQLVLVFILGAIVGSFCNVAVARLPYEKSLLWPGSRCGSCHLPIRWYDNLPLITYLWLKGRCRQCGAAYSSRYFWIELTAALGFVGLFLLEVAANIHQFDPLVQQRQNVFFPWAWQMGFLYHAVLFTFLLIASACDLDGRAIPFSLTFTGTLIGLIGATLLPWPYPWAPAQAIPAIRNQPALAWLGGELKAGIQPWPVWGPLPAWLAPGGNWQTGLVTGLVGALVGSVLLRVVRLLFSWGLGKEAMGLGDADLMMMAGSFLGWQPVVVAFFASVAPALFIGILLLIIKRDHSLPFGPSLSLGVLISMLGWGWIGPLVQAFFFWPAMLIGMAVFMVVILVVTSLILRRGGEEIVGGAS